MSKISLNNLSDNLKEYLNTLGLSEEQVLNLINENGLNEEELKAMLKDTMSINELNTNSKTVIGAINELFQSANNGKEIIADAIGEPLSAEDTFAAMGNDINDLLSIFKTNMMNNGVTVESGDKFKELIDKIKGLTEDEGNKGIQFAEGTCAVTNSLITHNCGFIPTYFFVLAGSISMQYKLSNGSFYNSVLYNPVISNIRMFGSSASAGIVGSSSITELNESTAKISNISGNVTWYAIGVGEEDTTLRDSLASILQEEGVDVTEEDDMASLIGKVDSEFEKKENEINNGKQIIADAIGDESITKDSTFEAMSEAIKEGSVDTGKWIELLALAGYSVSETDTMDDIYSKLQTTCKAVYDVEKVFCGYRTTFILKKDGTLWGCGQNDKGQLGLGTTSSTQKNFVQVTENVSDVKHIECGKETGFTYMLKNDGTLWSTGLNGHGQLGLGDSTNRNVFTQVTDNVEQVACGDYHAMILKKDGTIWTCGYNNLGQLGAGNTDGTIAKSFVKRSFNTTSIKKIDCGAAHSFVLTNDGSLWVCGYNENGQLGLNHNTSMGSFTKATVNVNNIADISCGCYNSLILKTDGTVWGCGNNANTPLSGISASNYCGSFTQLTGATNVMIAKVSLAYTMIVKNDGTVWACGVNTNGQLGTGNTTKQTKFIQVAKKITNVNQIACGDSHTCILCNDEYGKLYVTGLNGNGQLGLDSTSQKTSFTINTGFIL